MLYFDETKLKNLRASTVASSEVMFKKSTFPILKNKETFQWIIRANYHSLTITSLSVSIRI